jgi:DNA-binding GntR family transcriptional regulator
METDLFAGPAVSVNATEMALSMIRAAILNGRLAPAQRLKEGDLADELGISRTPVREALVILQTEGLVEAPRNRGARVRAYSAEELGHVWALRALLEGLAARKAATRIEDAQLEQVRAAADDFAAIADRDSQLEELVAHNARFHDLIIAAAASPRLAAMIAQARSVPLTYQALRWYTPHELEVSRFFHSRILAALTAHDPDRAEANMREHLQEGRAILLAHMAQRSSAHTA